MAKTEKDEAEEQGQRLKLFRKMLRYSQKEFGEKIDVSQPMMQKYETGLTRIPWDTIKRISLEFDMSFDWFATGTGLKRRSEQAKTLKTDWAEANTTIQMQEFRIAKLEKIVAGLVKELYAMKHNV